MIAKLIVHDVDREHARRRMLRALEEFEIGGVPTLVGFHRALLEHPCFVAGRDLPRRRRVGGARGEAEALASGDSVVSTTKSGRDGRLRERVRAVELDGRRFDVTLLEPEPPWAELARRRRERARGGGGGAGSDAVVSPMQGTVLKVEVADGDEVEPGQVLCVVEAMKMENEITAHRAGLVAQLSVAPGAAVTSGQVICVVQGECRPAALRGDVPGRRRAARGDGEPGRPLAPARVPRPLGARRRRRLDALRRGQGVPARRAPPRAAHAAALRPPPRAPGARRPAASSSRRRGGRARPAAARARRATTTCSSLDLATAGEPRRAIRSSSSARTASTTAAARSTAGRCTTRCASRSTRSWVWQSTHVGGDRFAGNLVALPHGLYYGRVEPSEVWPLAREHARGRDLPARATAGAPATRSRCRRPSGRSGTRPGLLGVDDVRLAGGSRTEDGWRVRLHAAAGEYEVDVRREDGEPTHLTCSAVQLRRPKRFVAESPRARAA